MTPEQLIEEGRRLQRPSVFLRPVGTGPVAAVWYEPDLGEIESTGHCCWLTVDARRVPGLPATVTGYLTVFTDEETCEGGRIEISPSWPNRPGTKLYAHAASVLPPLEAVFSFGSDAVGAWLHAHGWERTWGYNANFKGRDVVDAYERVHMQECPLYFESNVYAVLGGWHLPFPEDDWHDLIDEHLILLTLRGSEPWVEAWCTRAGDFRVIQRIT
jgi:hypothetical protein